MYIFAPVLHDRGVAQLVAHLLWEQGVPGSSPGTPTKYHFKIH